MLLYTSGPEHVFYSTPMYTTISTTEEIVDKIRYKHTKRRLPSCIIIGVRKAGTRALLTFLDLHPQIRTARNEVHFFDLDVNYYMGQEWYRKKMPYSFPDQITIEKTPAYFACDGAPSRIHDMNSSVKLLLIVRDPVYRSISDYLQIHLKRLNMGKKHQDFERFAIDEETGDIDATYNPIKRSLYYRYMKRWLSVFPRRQIHIVDGDRMTQDPVAELQKVERFLGLEHKITEDHFYFNETRGYFCLRNETGNKCLASSKGREHPAVDLNVLTKLRVFFRPFNRKFYNMIGQEFDWE